MWPGGRAALLPLVPGATASTRARLVERLAARYARASRRSRSGTSATSSAATRRSASATLGAPTSARWLASATAPSTRSTRPGPRPSGRSATTTSRRCCRRGRPDVRQPRPAAGLPALQRRRAADVLSRRARRAAPRHARRAGDDEPHAASQAGGLLRVGAPPGRDVTGLLPGPVRPARRIERGAELRPDALGSRGGQPWLLMEQAPSAVNWRARNAPSRRARCGCGAAGRRTGSGRGAVLPVAAVAAAPRSTTRRWSRTAAPTPASSVKSPRWGASWRGARGVAGTRVEADVALLLDWDSWWALEPDSHPALDLRSRPARRVLRRPL